MKARAKVATFRANPGTLVGSVTDAANSTK